MHRRCVGCVIESGSAVEPGLEGGEKSGQGPTSRARWECLSAAGGRATAARRRRLAGRQPGRSAEARAHDRRSGPITIVVITVGGGDAGPFRLGDTGVGRGVAALVAIGDGADAEHAHGARSSLGGSESPHGMGHRTRQRTIAMVIIIVTSAGVQSMRAAITTCGVAANKTSRAERRSVWLLRSERPSTVRSTEADAIAKP